ncbi:MAG: hypothetical protein R3A13_02230 [Bdellovibrionota bacterium]
MSIKHLIILSIVVSILFPLSLTAQTKDSISYHIQLVNKANETPFEGEITLEGGIIYDRYEASPVRHNPEMHQAGIQEQDTAQEGGVTQNFDFPAVNDFELKKINYKVLELPEGVATLEKRDEQMGFYQINFSAAFLHKYSDANISLSLGGCCGVNVQFSVADLINGRVLGDVYGTATTVSCEGCKPKDTWTTGTWPTNGGKPVDQVDSTSWLSDGSNDIGTKVEAVADLLNQLGINPTSLCIQGCPEPKKCFPENLINEGGDDYSSGTANGDGVDFDNPGYGDHRGATPPGEKPLYRMRYEAKNAGWRTGKTPVPKFKAKDCGCYGVKSN